MKNENIWKISFNCEIVQKNWSRHIIWNINYDSKNALIEILSCFSYEELGQLDTLSEVEILKALQEIVEK